jgi:glycosyltransferase involved in cell wall biosynthesis
VLFVGTLTRYKGCELVIRALSSTYLKNVNLVFNIVGRGEEEAFLKQLSRELNVQDKVIFHGFIPREQIKTFYYQADIFCFPTLKEAAGNVLLEAMSCALPIITVNTGGPKYMCSDKGCIKLPIQPMNEMTEAIAKALDNLAKDENLRSDMGLANRQHCLENYDWEAMKKKILTVFDESRSCLS